MCLATVYKSNEPDSILFQFVSKIEVDGAKVILTDVMGEQKTVEGTVKMVDLANSVIEINCVE